MINIKYKVVFEHSFFIIDDIKYLSSSLMCNDWQHIKIIRIHKKYRWITHDEEWRGSHENKSSQHHNQEIIVKTLKSYYIYNKKTNNNIPKIKLSVTITDDIISVKRVKFLLDYILKNKIINSTLNYVKK